MKKNKQNFINPSLYLITEKDIPKALECLKDAFKNDPLWLEVFKNSPDPDKSRSAFFMCPLLYGIKYGKVYATSDKLEGIAIWLSDKYANMTIWRMFRCGALPYGMKMDKQAMKKLAIVSKQIGHDRKKLMRGKSYIYLMIIGISSSLHGKGHYCCWRSAGRCIERTGWSSHRI